MTAMLIFMILPANVSFMEKPGGWFLLANCVKKRLWKSDILSKDAGQWYFPHTFCL